MDILGSFRGGVGEWPTILLVSILLPVRGGGGGGFTPLYELYRYIIMVRAFLVRNRVSILTILV